MSISLGPKLGLLFNSNISEYYADNFRTFLQALDQLIQGSIINATSIVPPTSPNPGDAYLLISGTPAGAWTGQSGKIAVWNTQVTTTGTNNTVPQWVFYTPKPGWTLWNSALSALYVYNGSSWSALTAATSEPISSYVDEISSGTWSPTANVGTLWALRFPSQHTFSNLGLSVATADNSSNLYNAALFDSSGNLLIQTGPTPGSTLAHATGFNTVSFEGTVTIPAGTVYLVITGNANTLALNTTPSAFTPTQAQSIGATTGAVLPATVSAPVTTWTTGQRPAVVLF